MNMKKKIWMLLIIASLLFSCAKDDGDNVVNEPCAFEYLQNYFGYDCLYLYPIGNNR